ncbi:MAG: hypothetical protein A3H69_01370 [Candidatus Sungbacteria bacterium RIFCSPLOWO2_02_FULL_47_9]|uniref:Cytochrome C biogenesis protein transmembrane domain-containing protein n=1 Tax=Candidatus Sungbacteria bacterium RIFCSPHIGHO2_01_FULL_47_32 TaxID=1802264 RepID=A0A1G2K5S3_9BACT|nr:MAG: Cytochrome c biogenesis protein transmembrane region [Parcubacteria group bacterium GW2011_GWA2_47_10]OGZ94776.1 MAG: hypothetical protein A2633_03420 [Candidatus Sungbacteria bacterium RIFCSPHIGHO2_01_FULL_47_32]OGZ97964.1 MAG: hypothetical protein A3D57_05070 [Candidatus Sungbacteria bacterium RIFCSPHIGHO2_02_FULL_46_12]OHA04891.1 MAG: hypothetical protein A3A28_05750 [Candidatus Sungbacteria bacterium RIFCSPLOWO2_01_FULL_47_32]OHA10177.1 MAG: hypothetical protein A3H69_01370 [Candida
MELLIGASFVAAFVAGVAALFAPCCITVLLPSYFASIFRERKKVFLMTFIFFLGILTVFMPIGLGASLLGKVFSRYHNTIFMVGGLFLLFLGFILILGKHYSLPFQAKPVIKGHNALSVYTLGIFSGIATTCCAPVLAGVMALSILPGSLLWGGVYTLSFVLGMVAPLFLIAFFLDKINFTEKFMGYKKSVEYTLGARRISVAISDLVAGAVFIAMGSVILFLAFTNRLFIHSNYQMGVNIYLTKFLDSIGGFVKIVPEYVWALVLVTVTIVIIRIAINQIKKEQYEKK